MEKIVFLKTELSSFDIEWVEGAVKALDCICSIYNEDMDERCSVSVYVKEKYIHGGRVHAVFDRNIMSSLTRAATNSKVTSDDERDALVLLCFLRIAEIEIEPGVCLAEYTDSYFEPNPESELQMLRKIDNIPNENLLRLAKGETSRIDISSSGYSGKPIFRNRIESGFDIHQWKLHYGYALKAFLLYHENHSSLEFLKKYIFWMWEEYALGALAFPFAGALLSPMYGRVIKGLNSTNEKKVISGIKNAAWDMTLVHYWMSWVVKRKPGGPLLVLCTRDKALRFLAENVASANENKTLDSHFGVMFGDFLKPKEVKVVLKYYRDLERQTDDPNRPVHKYRKNKDYFDEYINELEDRAVISVRTRAK